MTPRIGSVCTGYGGLDMAVQQVLGGELAWVADPDPGAAAILAHHHPTVPNLGDITVTDWAAVPPVDVLCGGYPCQPFSTAGLRRGTEDVRHLWPFIARALGVLRPRLAIFENVANHLRIGFADVLADLAALGFDAEWCLVRASEVGAPHRRERLFLLAWLPVADAADLGHQRGGRARDGRPGPADRGCPAADTEGHGRGRIAAGGRHPVQRGVRPHPHGRGATPADADSIGWGADQLDLRARELDATWGRYAPAVARWEPIQGRRVPRAVDPDGRLTPEFVEWDMGLPTGHVTNPAIWHGWKKKTARNAQLRALGNGVVPRQAAAAIPMLLDRAGALR